ncbi:MAG: FABP family protein [Candidatus Nitronauta litoralis]|uniref:FABP family protein n=1 Tax=Candidatus Nitronauta litoralis TaxID=2705533 RepID=A0A7T0G201_9BACT|nr:MAG: FABP family protein [Candidatus Nitronauta litoralis]
MDQDIIDKLGPLGKLAGIWEGDKGDDTAPSGNRETENNKFRERMTFDPFGPVNNHEQELFGLRYSTTAWKIGSDSPFHEELGYWLWDEANRQAMRCFIVPRGVNVLAGGTVKEGADSFELSAKAGSDTYGICSNLFLDKEFKTVNYLLKVTFHPDQSFSYEEDTQIQIKGKPDLFHHIDKNTLTKVT